MLRYLSNSFTLISIVVVSGALLFGTLGYFVAKIRGAALWLGIALGVVLGPLGLLILGSLTALNRIMTSSEIIEE